MFLFIWRRSIPVGPPMKCLKAYPKGNKKANHLSLYLAVANSEYLPFGWRRHAKFSFTVVNQFSYKLSRLGGDCFLVMHIISREGFSGMISLSELHDKEGFLVNREVKIVLKVDVLEVQGKVDVSEESLPVMETIDVNGFHVLPSQALCQSPWEISKDDLPEEYAALSYLAAEGFQLDWLGKKLDEVK
ncbi:hypothetical protein YC2023_093973 [Brassica napus]